MKTMKKIVLATFFSLSLFASKAQSAIDIEHGKTVTSNGIEYSYAITNERDEETYSRYEVTIKAQNKSGCQLIYLKNDNITKKFLILMAFLLK